MYIEFAGLRSKVTKMRWNTGVFDEFGWFFLGRESGMFTDKWSRKRLENDAPVLRRSRWLR